MTTPITQSPHIRLEHRCATAHTNAERLRNAGVLALCVVGGPGCGKTTLINRTMDSLPSTVRARVISCGTGVAPDLERLAHHDPNAIHISLDGHQHPEACGLGDALDQIDLAATDVLFIENVGTLSVVPVAIGQSVNVVIYSVAAGHDQPAKHPALTRSADVVVLNKTDLLPFVPFDCEHFRRVVHEINPTAPLFELSCKDGTGFEQWLAWVTPRPKSQNAQHASHWFG